MSDEPVISFSDRHPMSEWQIIQSLAKQGKPPPQLTPEELFEFDHDQYGGVEARLQADFAADGLATTTGYRQALERAGFRARLEMYRGLCDQTVAGFGEAHYRHYDRNYDFFVGLVEAGKLGGARVRAVRPSPDR